MDHDAREYLTKGFLKKDDLRRLGPQALTVAAVESRLGKAWDGKPAVNELVLVFTDGQVLSLRTQDNLKRVIETWGPDYDRWTGRVLEAYYSPEVRNPRGEAGGIRVRFPVDAAVAAASGAPRAPQIELPDEDGLPPF